MGNDHFSLSETVNFSGRFDSNEKIRVIDVGRPHFETIKSGRLFSANIWVRNCRSNRRSLFLELGRKFLFSPGIYRWRIFLWSRIGRKDTRIEEWKKLFIDCVYHYHIKKIYSGGEDVSWRRRLWLFFFPFTMFLLRQSRRGTVRAEAESVLNSGWFCTNRREIIRSAGRWLKMKSSDSFLIKFFLVVYLFSRNNKQSRSGGRNNKVIAQFPRRWWKWKQEFPLIWLII